MKYSSCGLYNPESINSEQAMFSMKLTIYTQPYPQKLWIVSIEQSSLNKFKLVNFQGVSSQWQLPVQFD